MTNTNFNAVNLSEIDDLSISLNEDGSINLEVVMQPAIVANGNGVAPQIFIAGLDVRVDDHENLEIHNIFLKNLPFVAFISYNNLESSEQEGVTYDSVRLEIFVKDDYNTPVIDEEFETIPLALEYVRQNYISKTPNDLLPSGDVFNNNSSRNATESTDHTPDSMIGKHVNKSKISLDSLWRKK